jgi:hypothetical protein
MNLKKFNIFFIIILAVCVTMFLFLKRNEKEKDYFAIYKKNQNNNYVPYNSSSETINHLYNNTENSAGENTETIDHTKTVESDTIKNNNENNEKNNTDETNQETTIKAVSETILQEDLNNLPKKVLNKAPFAPQAPYANWDHTHDEACEEAAIITAHYYLKNIKELSKEEVEKDILAMVTLQNDKYGGHYDLNAEKIIELANLYYNDNYQLIENYTLEEIKYYLANNHILIVPVAGRVLENPYFRQPGPLYHALVIIGYDEKKQQFITNEPGTKRGSEFRYSYRNLLDSIHDFPGKKEDILNGRRVIILVK